MNFLMLDYIYIYIYKYQFLIVALISFCHHILNRFIDPNHWIVTPLLIF